MISWKILEETKSELAEIQESRGRWETRNALLDLGNTEASNVDLEEPVLPKDDDMVVLAVLRRVLASNV